jgi:Fic family protein
VKPDFLARVIAAAAYSPTIDTDDYAHWDRLRYHRPPRGLTHEEWWAALKVARLSSRNELPFCDTKGVPFHVTSPDPLLRHLSDVDRDLSGRVPIPDQLVNPGTRDRYRVSASIEEAITSSQLEGASTTRRVAAEMLRSGRRPTDKSERMIFNNYLAIREIRELQSQPLTPAGILRVHRTLTDRTLDDPADGGVFRTSDDVKVYDTETGEVLHTPPTWSDLPRRMALLCDVANEKQPAHYVHPVVRALLLHFVLAYDHPFVDGNGRTARALFYWSMARSGYWLCEYLSISHFLRKAPSAYARSFLLTESDENDVTYFLLAQLAVLRQAISAMHEHVRDTMRGIQRAQALLQQSRAFNHRQLAVLADALRRPDASYSATAHANSHQVTRQTARTDLKELAARGLLLPLAVGRGFLFTVPGDLEDRLETLGSR